MRIRTRLTEQDKERVNRWAKSKGLRLGRAYTELIRIALRKVMQTEKEEEQDIAIKSDSWRF